MAKHFTFFLALLLAALSGFAQQPVFKGGEKALEKYLTDHIVYPEYSRKNCIGATIKVSFRVDKDGQLSDVKTVSSLGIDLDEEAIRVVKMTAGKWALPAGISAANLTLPVRFEPNYSRCVSSTGASREQAIQAYQSRQALEDAVTDYYKLKYAGKADAKQEDYINSLKKELGFDDNFIDDVLQQAVDKLKQGDREGACTDWNFIKNIGSDRADKFLTQYCK